MSFNSLSVAMVRFRERPSACFVRPVTTSYRADIAGRDGALDHADGTWITIAMILEHAAIASGPARDELLDRAIRLAHDVCGASEVRAFVEREWENVEPCRADAIVLLADQVQQRGGLNVAATLLDSLVASDGSLTTLQLGRIVAKRARIDWKLGRIEEAADRYAQVDRLGRRTNSAELETRSLIGLVALSQMRGNYPNLLRYARRAARVADRAGLRRLSREAHNGLMIAAGAARRVNEALIHGWIVYQASLGNAIDEAEILQNLGQVLFDSGHIAEARAAFSVLASRELPARILLPALGGLALASASTGHRATTQWAAREVQRMKKNATVPRYALASAALECAVALLRLDCRPEAESFRTAALQLSQKFNFHEITYRAEALLTTPSAESIPAPHAFSKRASAIARDVAWMEPKHLPRHAALASASA